MDWVHFRPRPVAWLFNQFTVGRYYREEKHPISRILFRLYERPCRFVIRHRVATIIVAALLVLLTIPVYLHLGSEFMPPLWEGDLLYMPTTLPGLSVTEAQRLMQRMDEVLMTVPEVDRVFGKAGRAETSTDPAPFSMMETTILLKPPEQWRRKQRWYSNWPRWMQAPFRSAWPDHISKDELKADLNARMQFAGAVNAWTMPIETRIGMLSTGIRTPIGIKIFGGDLKQIEDIGTRIETLLKDQPGVRSVYAERAASGFFLDFELKRDRLARYALSVADAEMVLESAVGGETVTTTIEGRERYSVNVRYARELRDDLPALQRVLVPTPSGAQVPLQELADLRIVQGPGMIRDEDGMLAGYVYVDTAESDIGGFVARLKSVVDRDVHPPAGYSLQWSGQYENMLRVRERLKVVVPITLFLIFILLCMNTKSLFKALLVMCAVPFSAIGAIGLLYLLGYNISIAVWVGLIALLGLDAETGVFMLLFLDLSYNERVREGKMKSFEDLTEAVIHGAVKRIRPKMMTVCAATAGLLPIMWSAGAGADMMKRVAAPLVGGLVTSFILELLVYPAVYTTWKWRSDLRRGTRVPQ
jgi:Cu(I)/Ag(I) efflux system membrane protein CusA/SilA